MKTCGAFASPSVGNFGPSSVFNRPEDRSANNFQTEKPKNRETFAKGFPSQSEK